LPPANGHRGLALAAGDRAVYCNNSDSLCVLDLKTGEVVQPGAQVMQGIIAPRPITVSADGRRVAVTSGKQSAGKDPTYSGQVLVYDVTAAKVVADVRIDGFDMYGAALSADGKRFAVLGVGVDPQGNPGKRVNLLEIRDVESGKTVSRMDAAAVEGYGVPVRFSPDGKYLAVAGWPGVEVWDTATGRSLWKDQQQVTALQFTPDSGRLLTVTMFGDIRSWDAPTGKRTSSRTLPRAVEYGSDSITDMVFTPDDRVVGLSWRGVVLSSWDLTAGKLLTPTDGTTWPITAVRFTPDGRQVIAATDALDVFRAEAATGRITGRIEPKLTDEQRADPILSVHPTHMAAVALAPDTRFLAYSTRLRHLGVIDLTTVRVLWSATTTGITMNDHVTPVFSPDSSKVSAGGYFEPRDRGDGRRSPLAWETVTGKPLPPWGIGGAALYTGIAGNAPVAFSPDGGTRAAVVVELGWPEGECLLARDLAADKPLARVSGGFGKWIAVAPDNRTLLMTEAHRIVGRDLLTGRVTRALDFPLPEDKNPFGFDGLEFGDRCKRPKFPPDRVGLHLTCPFTFSPDGRLFAVGVISPATRQPEIRVYEWAGFGHRFTLTGHAGSVRSLAFSPDGRSLASGSDDTTVLIWDLSKLYHGAAPKVLSTGESLWARLSSPETAPAWKAIRELAARPEYAVALVKERLKPAPPLTVTEADIPSLIRQLDAQDFPVRERAVQGLRELGHKAVPLLEQALKNPPSLEMKRRAENLLKESSLPDPAFPIRSRAVEVLEHIGSPAARAVLQSLSDGAPGHPLTEEARAALRRINKSF
jgi:WD40 repeat protein